MGQIDHFDIKLIIPHRGMLLLVDRVLEYGAEMIAVESVIPPDGPFHADTGVPSYVGVEYMAQAIACWAGYQAKKRGEPPPVGFLLGTRRYECAVPQFDIGDVLRVEARREIVGADGLAVFSCRIEREETELATANVSVFQPPDISAYLGDGT